MRVLPGIEPHAPVGFVATNAELPGDEVSNVIEMDRIGRVGV
jgi:hypothetical protein